MVQIGFFKNTPFDFFAQACVKIYDLFGLAERNARLDFEQRLN